MLSAASVRLDRCFKLQASSPEDVVGGRRQKIRPVTYF